MDSETRFWLRTVAVGGWLTLLMCAVAGVYALGFAGPDNRLAVCALIAFTAVLGALVLWVIPWRRIVASRWREVAMLFWTAMTVGTVAALAALDGGAGSPLALALLLPAVFASLAFSLSRVFLIGVLTELAYLLLTLIGSPGPAEVLVFCSVLGGTIVMAVGQAGFHQEWRRQLALSSRTDPLTGLLNRRGLAMASDSSFSDLLHHRRQVTLLLFDLDLFKAYNDTHGHQAGDELLRWVGDRLAAAVRPSDSVARLGGDEFAVLLPDTDRAAAEPLIERIRESLQPRISCCLGSATAPADGHSFDDLYRVGDAALYQSKLLRSQVPLSAGSILSAVPEGFFILDEEGRFVYVNAAAADWIGRPCHELLGRAIWDAFPGSRGARFVAVYRRVAAFGHSARFVEPCPRLETTFSVKVSPVPGGTSVYLHDLTDEVETRPPPLIVRRTTPGREAAGGEDLAAAAGR